MKYKYTAQAIKWFDKVNGNTYHSVRITNNKTGKVLYCPFEYGYGDQYRYTALQEMYDKKWISNKRYKNNPNDKADERKWYAIWERENGYPVNWIVNDGLKRECIANGKER